jgi:hypothetical protein
MWIVQSVEPSIRPRNDVYGHFFAVKFKLQYVSMIGSFVEMPRLEWKETITMVEQKKGQWWQFVMDQYDRNPHSPTFSTWVNRYIYAYDGVRRQQYATEDATNLLFNKNGQPLPPDTFPRLNTPKEKADAVRSYLKRHGGIMTVTVVDKPGINKPQAGSGVHKNRILTFDCGLRGVGARVRAVQSLVVDASQPKSSWVRSCALTNAFPQARVGGLRKVTPPDDVSILKPFMGGAQQGTYS